MIGITEELADGHGESCGLLHGLLAVKGIHESDQRVPECEPAE